MVETRVFGVGRSSWEAAEYYALETDGRLSLVERALALTDIDETSLIITDYAQLADVLDRTGPNSASIGVITGSNQQELMRRARFLVARHGLLRTHISRIDILPEVPVGRLVLNARVIVGAHATEEELNTCLGADTDILTILSHSDGIDVDLGRSVLCSVKGRTLSRSVQPPTCLMRSYCHRVFQPVNAALSSGRLIETSRLRARVVILMTCFATPMFKAPIDVEWSLLAAIMEGSGVEAVIAAQGSIFPRVQDMELLLELLQAGCSTGEALRRFEETSEQTGIPKLRLFGHPDLRLTEPRNPSSLSVRRKAEGMASSGGAGDFFRYLLRGCSRRDDGGRVELIRNAEEAFEAGAPLAATASSLVTLIASFGTMPCRQWLPPSLQPRRLATSERPCYNCGRETISFIFDLPDLDQNRFLVSCDSCGIVDDAAAGALPRHLKIHGDKLELSGVYAEPTYVAFLIEPGRPFDIVQLGQQEVAAGDSDIVVDLPTDIPPGVTIISAVEISSTLRVLRIPVRINSP